jgi:hypothetical protein
VVCLVLETPRQHAFPIHRHGVAVDVHSGNPRGTEAADRKAEPGDGEAAFHFVRLVVLAVFQDRVDDVAFNPADPVREDPEADAYLRGGQAGAFHVLHRFGHVGNEPGQLWPEIRDRFGHRAQHGIADDTDIQNCHLQSFPHGGR